MPTIAVLLVGALWLGAMLTGCSSEPEDNRVEYTIGVGVPLTANAVAVGQGIVRGAKIAAAGFNESPESTELGIKFVIAEADDEGDQTTGVTVANSMIENNALVGVVGHLNSAVSIPASKIYNDAGIVMVSPGSTAIDLTKQGFDNVFRTCTTDAVQGPAAAQAAVNLGYMKTAVIDDSTDYGVGLAAAFSESYEALGGEIVLVEKTTDKETNFSALITKVMAADVDLIFFAGIYEPASYFLRQLHAEGGDEVVMGGDALNNSTLVEVAGAEAAEDTLVIGIGYPADSLPAGQDFKASFAEMFPDEKIDAFDAYGHDAAVAIINACVESAEVVGADKLATAEGRKSIIKSVSTISFEGVTGPVSFDEFGDPTNKAVTVYRIEGGKFVPYLLPDQI